MKILRVEFKNLFQEFSYSISLDFKDGIIILTGPNGYGKSTILRTIYHFMRREFYYFTGLSFSEIRFIFDSGEVLILEKGEIDGRVVLTKEGDSYNRFTYLFDESKIERIDQILINSLNFKLVGTGRWMSIKTREVIEIAELFEYLDRLPIELQMQFQIDLPEEWVKDFFSQELLLMGAQRLRRSQIAMQYGLSCSNQSILEMSAIKRYAIELSDKICNVSDEEKEDLSAKIEVFVDIINRKGFHGKKIKVERERGFVFISNHGKELDPTFLSSGEQQVIVMLYKLIFRVASQTVVLIDEPEISLHIVWQKEYIEELKQIGSVQHIEWMIATHSPLIINDHWEQTIDLFELSLLSQSQQ